MYGSKFVIYHRSDKNIVDTSMNFTNNANEAFDQNSG